MTLMPWSGGGQGLTHSLKSVELMGGEKVYTRFWYGHEHGTEIAAQAGRTNG